MLASLLVTIAIAGVVGGSINYLLAEKPVPVGQRLRKWWQYAVIGLGASFTVPLFLNTISSSLVKEVLSADLTPSAAANLLVIAGFCILASVSSRAFMQTLTSRVLKIAQNANQTAKSALETATHAQGEVDKVIEPDDRDDIPHTRTEDIVAAATAITKFAADDKSGEVISDEQVEPDENVVLSTAEARTLHAISGSGYIYRTVGGIASTIGVAKSSAQLVLSSLEERGLVKSKSSDNGPRKYRLTAGGQRAIWSHELRKPK